MDPKQLDALRKTYGGPMSDAEIEFLRDIQSFLDFAIRNGLSFALALGALSHDINGLLRYGFSIDEARSDQFVPKTAGYAGSRVGTVDESGD